MASRNENQVIKNILAMIAKSEGTTKREGNPYDVVVGFGNFLKPGDNDPSRNIPTANKPVSQMTFKEVKEFGRALVNATKGKNKDGSFKIGDNSDGSSAVGKYQLLANYFNTDGDGIVGNLQKKLRARGVKGFKDTDIFNERAQDLLAIELLKENDGKLNGKKILADYVESPSEETMDKLMEKIASKWQGVPTAKSGRKNFQKREINYAQAVDMLELPESQYKYAGADEKGLMTTKNKPPFRNIDDTERMLADELVSSPQTAMRNIKSEEEKKRENRIARNQLNKSNTDRTVEKMRELFKEKETIAAFKDLKKGTGIMSVIGPTKSFSSALNKLLESKNIIKDIDELDNNAVLDIFKYFGEKAKEILSIGEAEASEKFNIDQIKTLNQKFQELIANEGPGYDTSDIGVSGKPDTILSEEAGSPDMIGDTSNIYAPLVEYGGDKVGTAPELLSDIDNSAKTRGIFENLGEPAGSPQAGIEPPIGQVVPPPRRTNDINLALANERSETQLNPSEIRAMEDESFAEEGGERDDFSPNYSIVDSIPMEDANEIGSGDDLGTRQYPDSTLEMPETIRDQDAFARDLQPFELGGQRWDKDYSEPESDLSYFENLFTGLDMQDVDSDFERDLQPFEIREEPMEPYDPAEDFEDEPEDTSVDYESDFEADQLNLEHGGSVEANFDGKDTDDEEGDPPPLAKPKEVADDIPAMLSEGEYVLPANVVRYLGLERITDMHKKVLSEINQMEELGIIQNVDENGTPEKDTDEMKFIESEDVGGEADPKEDVVSKGTVIIASAKPKGMMCDPLAFEEGGMWSEVGGEADPKEDVMSFDQDLDQSAYGTGSRGRGESWEGDEKLMKAGLDMFGSSAEEARGDFGVEPWVKTDLDIQRKIKETADQLKEEGEDYSGYSGLGDKSNNIVKKWGDMLIEFGLGATGVKRMAEGLGAAHKAGLKLREEAHSKAIAEAEEARGGKKFDPNNKTDKLEMENIKYQAWAIPGMSALEDKYFYGGAMSDEGGQFSDKEMREADESYERYGRMQSNTPTVFKAISEIVNPYLGKGEEGLVLRKTGDPTADNYFPMLSQVKYPFVGPIPDPYKWFAGKGGRFYKHLLNPKRDREYIRFPDPYRKSEQIPSSGFANGGIMVKKKFNTGGTYVPGVGYRDVTNPESLEDAFNEPIKSYEDVLAEIQGMTGQDSFREDSELKGAEGRKRRERSRRLPRPTAGSSKDIRISRRDPYLQNDLKEYGIAGEETATVLDNYQQGRTNVLEGTANFNSPVLNRQITNDLNNYTDAKRQQYDGILQGDLEKIPEGATNRDVLKKVFFKELTSGDFGENQDEYAFGEEPGSGRFAKLGGRGAPVRPMQGKSFKKLILGPTQDSGGRLDPTEADRLKLDEEADLEWVNRMSRYLNSQGDTKYIDPTADNYVDNIFREYQGFKGTGLWGETDPSAMPSSLMGQQYVAGVGYR